MQGWKTENCSSLPKELEMVNASTYIQRRNITRVERDSMDGSEEKEVSYACEYRFLSEDEYYNLLQQEENTEKVNENILISMRAQAELYEKLLATEENQIIIMQAVAELYEAQTGGN
jgi:hypothetical protein